MQILKRQVFQGFHIPRISSDKHPGIHWPLFKSDEEFVKLINSNKNLFLELLLWDYMSIINVFLHFFMAFLLWVFLLLLTVVLWQQFDKGHAQKKLKDPDEVQRLVPFCYSYSAALNVLHI